MTREPDNQCAHRAEPPALRLFFGLREVHSVISLSSVNKNCVRSPRLQPAATAGECLGDSLLRSDMPRTCKQTDRRRQHVSCQASLAAAVTLPNPSPPPDHIHTSRNLAGGLGG